MHHLLINSRTHFTLSDFLTFHFAALRIHGGDLRVRSLLAGESTRVGEMTVRCVTHTACDGEGCRDCGDNGWSVDCACGEPTKGALVCPGCALKHATIPDVVANRGGFSGRRVA